MIKVGCAGLLVADTFCGPMPELPREGQLLAIDGMTSSAGGCAVTVAFDLVRQGVSVDLAGCLGCDAAAETLLSSFKQHGAGCSAISQVKTHSTSQTVILIVAGQDRRYIHVFGANAALTVGHLSREWLRSLKVFYLGGLFALPGLDVFELAEALKYCRENGVITVVDVVVPQDSAQSQSALDDLGLLLPHIDYFLPNDDEAEQLTGHSDPLNQMRAFQNLGANTVIITRGTLGSLAARGGKYWQSAAYEMKAVDASGSGDAFTSGVIAGILHGWDVPQILRYAGAIGGSATLAVGTTQSVFTVEEAEAFIAGHPLQIVSGHLEHVAISSR